MAPDPPAGRARPRLVALAGLAAGTALLALGALDPPGRAALAGTGLFDLRSGAGLRAAATWALLFVSLETLRFAPLGAAAVYLVPDHARRLARLARVALPALLLALPSAWVALRLRAAGDPFAVPGPLDLLLPWTGCALGVAAGLAWRRGPRARLLFVPVLAGLGLAAGLGAGLFGLLNLEREPLAPEPPPVTSDGKRALVAALRGKDPRKVPDGARRTLELTEQQVDLALAWGLPVVVGAGRARAAVRFEAPDQVAATASLRVPRVARWLNLEASARVRLAAGRIELGAPRVRIGRVRPPGLLLDALAPLLAAALQHERRLRPVLAASDALVIERGRARVSYGRLRSPPGFFAGLVWGEGSQDQVRAAVAEHVRGLLEAAPRLPRGEARFGAVLELAFAAARERSARASALEENRAAVLALGVLFGHRRLERLVGAVLDARDRPRAQALMGTPTLRGRPDWTRHFLVSAALTVMSAEAPSDEAGLLKEELDAAHGSGFSFADLLADRAGTRFALAATRDEDAAVAMQARLARGFVLDELFPEAADLPEGLKAAEFQARYGGVGGAGYRELTAEIERRLSACAAYREQP